jgi:hypothetical protein
MALQRFVTFACPMISHHCQKTADSRSIANKHDKHGVGPGDNEGAPQRLFFAVQGSVAGPTGNRPSSAAWSGHSGKACCAYDVCETARLMRSRDRIEPALATQATRQPTFADVAGRRVDLRLPSLPHFEAAYGPMRNRLLDHSSGRPSSVIGSVRIALRARL